MKNFLHIRDIPVRDLKKIISDAKNRKAKRKRLNTLDPDKDAPLKGKILLQMFEKSSLRTRLSFYLAIKQLGGGSLTLRPEELHLKTGGESIADTSKILSTYGNAFMLRTDSDKKLDEFKKYSNIPIINGLSPSSHPTQVLSDIFTIQEIKKKSISKLKLCWIGDANNNMMNSLIEACIKFSIKLNIACPNSYQPNKALISLIKKQKGKIKIYIKKELAIKNSDVVMTDKIISLNDKVNKKKKLNSFKNFKVDTKTMNLAKKDAIFLHCLPRGNEVTEEVFLGKKSKVWQQALNRVYVQKSILLYCFGKLR
ncbi:ornithine carbamoyltransferase [Pelagibacterales bacterium SAG-MED23]|nr:ornithine carbamoyltransferase [Pelagibacterales bacterium SAG-MED23]